MSCGSFPPGKARLLLVGGLVGLVLGAGMAPAQVRRTHVVMNNRGGLVEAAAQRVDRLRAQGQPVAIRGRVCLSSCTLYLGAGDVCVSPKTVFGFHGPSRKGRALGAEEFEVWSQRIASYYPPALRRWYLDTARYRLHGYYRLTGTQLIAMGYSSC